MERFGVLLIVVLAMLLALVYFATQLTDIETDRLRAEAAKVEAEGRAQAAILTAQGQARLDSAQAMIPILAVIVLGLFGFAGLVLIAVLGVVFVSYLVKLRDYRQPPPQNIYILPRGAYHPALPAPHEPLALYDPERAKVSR
jgi:hypothetical protein